MYRELAAAPPLTNLVAAAWVRDPAAAPTRIHRIVPDGCIDLIWVDGELLVAGPDSRAHLAPVVPDSRYVAVRFRPGMGPHVLGVPGHEMRNQRVPLADIWGSGVARAFADRVTAVAPAERPAALQAGVADRLGRMDPPEPVIALIVRQQRAGVPVATTAAHAGYSERQLHRRCLAAFGYGAKTLARVLRFQRALALARAGVPLGEVACRCGYTDQPHLAREVRALAGVPLTALSR